MIMWADFPTGSQGVYGDDESLMLNGLYAQFNGTLTADPDPAIGAAGRVLTNGSGTSNYLRRVFGGSYAAIGLAWRIWLYGLPTTNGAAPVFMFCNSANEIQCAMRINTDGTMTFFKGPNLATPIGTTAAPAVVANAWQHIEWKYVSAAVGGRIELRVEGTTVFEFDGNTAVVDTMTQFRLDSSGAPTGWALKDMVAWNTLGGVADDFIGPCSVYYLLPDADISSGWSRTSGATDFGILDNVPPLDGTYIYAGEDPVIPAACIVGCGSLPEDVVAVRAVLPILRARKSDGGEGKVQVSLVSGADEDPGTDRAISTAFTYWWDVSHFDPATLDPWTPAAVDAAGLKIDRTI